MDKEIVRTENAPAAVGPYSQGVRVGHFVFTAGQAGLDPATGKLAEGGIVPETRQVLNNLAAVLEAAGSGLDQVIKTTVFLQDMGQFKEMNEEYARHFTGEPPARTTVEAAALPLGAVVEIEAIAML